MDDKLLQIARGNHTFYYVIVGMEMCSRLFAEAVLRSFDRPVQYGIEVAAGYSGYILIDSMDIKKQYSQGSLMDYVRNGGLGDVALRIPRLITGEMNTDVTIVHGIHKFSFKITKYERDRDHGFEMINDPTLADEEEKLGRFIELKITIAPGNERQS